MKQPYKVAIAALLLVVSSTAVVGARSPADASNAFAVEGRPIEAVICHVDDDGTAKYMIIRSKSALQTHLQKHSLDYKFGSKIGPCETGGAKPPADNASGGDATPSGVEEANTSPASEPNASETATAA